MTTFDISTEGRYLGRLAPRTMVLGLAGAGLGLAGSLAFALTAEGGLERMLASYLVSFAFFLSLSLGALFFVLLQHVTRAGWSVVVRRVAEAMAANVEILAVLAIPIVVGAHQLYHWSHTEAVAGDPILSGKAAYLNTSFFTVRMALYFVVWIVLARMLFSKSKAQDATGQPSLTLTMERLSAPGMVLYALTVNFASFDLLMSLDPHWFSTIFGVYYFAGAVVGSLAALVLVFFALQSAGRLSHAVSIEHYHDIGKLLFAFVVFWAYIAFSQYMLIWYGNLPEETGWYLDRQTGGWGWVSLTLLFGHFVLPFLALISRVPKRRPLLLVVAAIWMLVMHWVDIYWLAMPELIGAKPDFAVVDVLCFVALAGVWVAGAAWRLRRCSLIPLKDPRIAESVAFENA